jgi:hypothetical protein
MPGRYGKEGYEPVRPFAFILSAQNRFFFGYALGDRILWHSAPHRDQSKD